MRNYINYILIPYKNRVIEENGLPEGQVTLFKSDIHYSHKDAEVIKLLKENNIIPFFTPAKLTDVFQECDVVANKPFKDAIKAAFSNHLHSMFNEHISHKVKSLPLSIHC